MLKQVDADKDYIKSKTRQLSDYRKEYFEFLDKTGRTRINSNEWIGTSKVSKSAQNKAIKSLNNWQNKQEKIKQQQELIKNSIVGKFDISKYDKNIITTTKDVILMPDRLKHIKERHPEVEKYINDISKIIKNPDMILKELKREDTIWIMKKMDDNIKLTLKLNTDNNRNYKNSIIQMQKMRDSEINRNIRNKKVTIIFDKNNKE
ncbi:MAG: PBECR2 nuclease fold domain-containing protein [Bacilli bacterium]